jgi:hypothetical protein
MRSANRQACSPPKPKSRDGNVRRGAIRGNRGAPPAPDGVAAEAPRTFAAHGLDGRAHVLLTAGLAAATLAFPNAGRVTLRIGTSTAPSYPPARRGRLLRPEAPNGSNGYSLISIEKNNLQPICVGGGS